MIIIRHFDIRESPHPRGWRPNIIYECQSGPKVPREVHCTRHTLMYSVVIAASPLHLTQLFLGCEHFNSALSPWSIEPDPSTTLSATQSIITQETGYMRKGDEIQQLNWPVMISLRIQPPSIVRCLQRLARKVVCDFSRVTLQAVRNGRRLYLQDRSWLISKNTNLQLLTNYFFLAPNQQPQQLEGSIKM